MNSKCKTVLLMRFKMIKAVVNNWFGESNEMRRMKSRPNKFSKHLRLWKSNKQLLKFVSSENSDFFFLAYFGFYLLCKTRKFNASWCCCIVPFYFSFMFMKRLALAMASVIKAKRKWKLFRQLKSGAKHLHT